MIPLLKRVGRQGNRGGETGGGGNRGKVKPVKLPQALGVMTLGTSTKDSTSVTVQNKACVKVENYPTTRVNNLTTRNELHGMLRNMKGQCAKKSLAINKEGGTC